MKAVLFDNVVKGIEVKGCFRGYFRLCPGCPKIACPREVPSQPNKQEVEKDDSD